MAGRIRSEPMNQPSKNSADMGIHADAIHSLAEQYNIDEKKVIIMIIIRTQ